MQRRLKIAFHVEDLAKPSGERIIIAPMQVTVEFDGSNLERPSQASEELDAAGLIIGRFVLLTIAGKAPPTHGADIVAVPASERAPASADRVAGYKVPPEAIAGAAKRIEYQVSGGVDPEHIVVEVLREALPFIVPRLATIERQLELVMEHDSNLIDHLERHAPSTGALSRDVPGTKGDSGG